LDEPPSGKSGQEDVEQAGIFGGEQPRQPAVLGVVDRQPRLHAGKPCVLRSEGLQRAAKLIGLRPVLGVVDHEVFAAREP
jgi:hypothetical protein